MYLRTRANIYELDNATNVERGQFKQAEGTAHDGIGCIHQESTVFTHRKGSEYCIKSITNAKDWSDSPCVIIHDLVNVADENTRKRIRRNTDYE